MFSFGKGNQPQLLIVGLGNPESKYDRTRHNTGFRALDTIAEKNNIKVDHFKYKGMYGIGTIGDVKVMLLKPTTYMNASGDSVREAAQFYKIPADRVLVIFDDISLPLGKIRIRKNGSAGGHNGIKSIIAQLGTDQFPRVKVGVGEKPHPEMDLADWVLSTYTAQEEKVLGEVLKKVSDAVDVYLKSGCNEAMNRYNG